MARIKRGTTANKRRKNILKLTKGFRWRRKSHYRAAKEAMMKAGKYAYRDRRNKKREMRALWIKRLNNALRLHGTTYARFINMLKVQDIALDRKVLSQMAVENPETFATLVEGVLANAGNAPTKKATKKAAATATTKTATKKAAAKKATKKAATKKAASGAKDDLTKVEGIGPKIASVLADAGISTFAALADTTAEKVQELITDVRGNHDATTWPKQASLAADGKWDELKKWQDELDGGKA